MSAFGLMDIAKTCVCQPRMARDRNRSMVRKHVCSGGTRSSLRRAGEAMKVRRSYGESGPSGLSVDALVFLNLVTAFTGFYNSHVLMTVPDIETQANRLRT